ncbi:MotA/TolQ/ExbB proton channel family protein [Paucibacter sp. B2R-40]|uniref:MotA/TolQ/ExbB proton channel family protein n=1 Tax=Paucibacter sp. B2R-40 TaxID=2893554 RepID=UPI00398D52DF
MKTKTHNSHIARNLSAGLMLLCAAGLTLAQPSTVAVDNPYGVGALWAQSDLVTKTVLLILAVMSIGSWYILITKLLQQAKIVRQSRDAKDKFWAAPTVREGAEGLGKDSPFRYLAEAGLDASGKHTKLQKHIGLHDWVTLSIERAVEKVQGAQQQGLAFLAAVSSTAPFVGLFGTVWGIYHALTAIGVAGQASIDKVAGPVGEALIMTAIGLAVAVPALLGYNWLARRNKAAIDEVQSFGDDLHTALLAQSGH